VTDDLFAGIPVSDYTASLAWYERRCVDVCARTGTGEARDVGEWRVQSDLLRPRRQRDRIRRQPFVTDHNDGWLPYR
jgi:hypothetical protein